MKRLLILFAALCLFWAGTMTVSAAEVDCDAVYCFSREDFSEEALTGICITGVPERRTGDLLLGTRVLQPGDILTVDQLARMTFSPARTESDCMAAVTYLPIFSDHVAPADTMTLSIRGKEDLPPPLPTLPGRPTGICPWRVI